MYDQVSKPEEEGIQVIIRIKPRTDESADEDLRKCVMLSPTEENTIVLETQSKKQYFAFDHIASEEASQEEIFGVVGHPVLDQSFKGFNCCIFAYGQTGAGKTYSILGNQNDLIDDHYADSRGVLPRLLQQLFLATKRGSFTSVQAKCSYLEIYNQQIIDLLNKDIKAYQIREDKRGVYVEGLSEEPISSYEDALEYIMKGLKNRKIAATSMNSESSRSHTIFTVMLKLELEEDGVSKTRTSKIHIVDLAGSERIKLAKVQGDRLKEGCNINKSLSSLGNVINSLVESAKKKKYIPFRDSKLTFFLKDSLGGNSKTKLLACINPLQAYLSNTISTLMFAKRAKIIKSRVQANQNIADNFESLRSEIRKLREELAQTKFIKSNQELNNIPISNDSNIYLRQESIPLENNFMSPTNNNSNVFSRESTWKDRDLTTMELDQSHTKILKVFEDNQVAYRNIIAVYQQRFNALNLNKNMRPDSIKFKTLFEDKKIMERACTNYASLVANFPAFTRIFSDNLEFRKKTKQQESKLAEERLAKEAANAEIQNLKTNNRYLKDELEQLHQEIGNLKAEIQQKTSIIQQQQRGSHKKDYQQQQLASQQAQSGKKPLEINLQGLNLSPTTEYKRRSTMVQKTKRDELREILNRQNAMLEQYETAITTLKAQFEAQITTMKLAYCELENLYQAEKKEKLNIRKQKNKKDLPPNVQTLENENEYLKLNIMELETEMARVEDLDFKNQIALKTAYEDIQKLKHQLSRLHENGVDETELVFIINHLKTIKAEAEKDNQQLQAELERDYEVIKQVKLKLMDSMKENHELLAKNESLTNSNTTLKKKLADLMKMESENSAIIKENPGWTTLEQGDFEEDLFDKPSELAKQVDRLSLEKDQILKKLQEQQQANQDDRGKLEKASSRILSLTKEVTLLKEQVKHECEQNRRNTLRVQELEAQYNFSKDQQRLADIDYNRLRKQLEKFEGLATRVRQEFLKDDLTEVVEEYKLLKVRNQLLNQENERLRTESLVLEKLKPNIPTSKSVRTLTVVKQLDSVTPRTRDEHFKYSNYVKQELKFGQTIKKEKEQQQPPLPKKKDTFFGKKPSSQDIPKPIVSMPTTTMNRGTGTYVNKQYTQKLKFNSKDK